MGLFSTAAKDTGDRPAYKPTAPGTVRDPEAMEDTPSQIWAPDDTDDK
ncbi:hypothetical protein ACJWDR_28965 [Streptomyces tauricus]